MKGQFFKWRGLRAVTRVDKPFVRTQHIPWQISYNKSWIWNLYIIRANPQTTGIACMEDVWRVKMSNSTGGNSTVRWCLGTNYELWQSKQNWDLAFLWCICPSPLKRPSQKGNDLCMQLDWDKHTSAWPEMEPWSLSGTDGISLATCSLLWQGCRTAPQMSSFHFSMLVLSWGIHLAFSYIFKQLKVWLLEE